MRFIKGNKYIKIGSNVVFTCLIADEQEVAMIDDKRNIEIHEISEEIEEVFMELNDHTKDLPIIEDFDITENIIMIERWKVIKELYIHHYSTKKNVDESINATKAVLHELF